MIGINRYSITDGERGGKCVTWHFRDWLPSGRSTSTVINGSPTKFAPDCRQLSTIDIILLMGVVAGALASALLTRSFHLIIPEAQHLKHLLAGGALMGIGSICAGGCNIGAGLTGMSTGSIRALTALVAIVAGMLLGIALLTRTEKIAERDYHHHPTTHGVGA